MTVWRRETAASIAASSSPGTTTITFAVPPRPSKPALAFVVGCRSSAAASPRHSPVWIVAFASRPRIVTGRSIVA
ncbi:MAG: hypothetical protein ACK6CT_02375 [Planctomycetia bacterium]